MTGSPTRYCRMSVLSDHAGFVDLTQNWLVAISAPDPSSNATS